MRKLQKKLLVRKNCKIDKNNMLINFENLDNLQTNQTALNTTDEEKKKA